jgi:hypothetical protein
MALLAGVVFNASSSRRDRHCSGVDSVTPLPIKAEAKMRVIALSARPKKSAHSSVAVPLAKTFFG